MSDISRNELYFFNNKIDFNSREKNISMSTPADKVFNNINQKAFTELTGYYLDYNSPVCKKVFKDWDKPKELHIENQNARFLESYDRHIRAAIKNKNAFK